MIEQDWPGLGAHWARVAWWHRVRPDIQIDFFPVMGPLGPAMVTASRRSAWVPEEVKDSRTALGFPRVHRMQGERP